MPALPHNTTNALRRVPGNPGLLSRFQHMDHTAPFGDGYGSAPAAPSPTHQRAYKACIPCRKRKAKCDLGGRDGPPCVRCRRELRECVFSAERSLAKKRKHGSENAGITTNDNAQAAQHATNDRVAPMYAGSEQQQSPHIVSARGVEYRAFTDNAGKAATSGADVSSLTEADPVHDLSASVMRTVVSNGNDALNLLFEAATQQHADDVVGQPTPRVDSTHQADLASMGPFPSAAVRNGSPRPVIISSAALSVQKLWQSSRFVRMGWLSAEEIITLLDQFYLNMQPMSPVLTKFYADHSNHRHLVTSEPLLCCTILMISSRYHVLPGAGGASRGYFIHERLWQHCQNLITRLLFGQEKGTTAKLRSLGSIEALLLLSEWHPRALHFPPQSDGWDSDLLITESDDNALREYGRPPNNWREDVVEPARRSDRMSWMLLGCALSLAHELDVFGDNHQSVEPQHNHEHAQKMRARRHLYVFVNQLASRTGSTSMLPQHLSLQGGNAADYSAADRGWNVFISAWTELTRLLKSFSEMVFPSALFTKKLLRSGRYIGVLEHFRPLLDQWHEKYLQGAVQVSEAFQAMLFIEYQYVRIYCNSIGMQAVCERALGDIGVDGNSTEGVALSAEGIEQTYIQEVIAGSCDMLEEIVGLAQKGTLRFAPVRIFLRITTSSVFLLKAMSIGVRNGQLRSALSILDQTVQALRSSVLDDMHLANSYAVLLEVHIKQLRKGFLVSSKRGLQTRPPTRRPSVGSIDGNGRSNTQQGILHSGSAGDGTEMMNAAQGFNLTFDQPMSDDYWLYLPFDPTMAPFGPDGASSLPSGLESNGLDFIWNLPT